MAQIDTKLESRMPAMSMPAGAVPYSNLLAYAQPQPQMTYAPQPTPVQHPQMVYNPQPALAPTPQPQIAAAPSPALAPTPHPQGVYDPQPIPAPQS